MCKIQLSSGKNIQFVFKLGKKSSSSNWIFQTGECQKFLKFQCRQIGGLVASVKSGTFFISTINNIMPVSIALEMENVDHVATDSTKTFAVYRPRLSSPHQTSYIYSSPGTSKVYILRHILSGAQRVVHQICDWAKYQNRHSSKSIQVIKLSFCQNDPPMGGPFWQKDLYFLNYTYL